MAGPDSPRRPPPPPPPDEEFVELQREGLDGRYDVLKVLGHGGMADVYLGRHRVIQKPVAIKVLNRAQRNNQEIVERFLREARAASKIRHPNIIDVTDFGTATIGAPYVVLEYLEGEDLATVVERSAPMELPAAREITLQVLRALEAAHAQGVIHRDIKPANCFVMRGANDEVLVKVLDFGFAKLTGPAAASAEDSNKLTKTGFIVGTLTYMSPEQGLSEQVDGRTDIYSTGIMLFEMLTGRVPFHHKNVMKLLIQHRSAEIPDMNTFSRGDIRITPETEAIVRRALAKSADDRFQTAGEFAEALEGLSDGGPSWLEQLTGRFPALFSRSR